MYIHIADLRAMLRTDVDLLSNRWLFKYLTQILDSRMLEMIQRAPARWLATPISLNLNIPTLLSTRFAEFDAAIKPAARASIVLELQIADVFLDMGAFLAAKDTVQKLGYRVCLDGVTDISFPQIDRQRLGFDLIKLIWNADSEMDIGSERNRKLAEAIRQCGANRVILTRCDNQHAVEYGQALGITLFQGRHLDGQLNPRAAVKN
jgi:EAL domain-containing protein (putative c-di-GMP-specific phosphodiesterase class I)